MSAFDSRGTSFFFFYMSCMNIEQRTNLVAAFFFFFVACLLKGCCRVKVCLQVFVYFQSSCVLPFIATAGALFLFFFSIEDALV